MLDNVWNVSHTLHCAAACIHWYCTHLWFRTSGLQVYWYIIVSKIHRYSSDVEGFSSFFSFNYSCVNILDSWTGHLRKNSSTPTEFNWQNGLNVWYRGMLGSIFHCKSLQALMVPCITYIALPLFFVTVWPEPHAGPLCAYIQSWWGRQWVPFRLIRFPA